MGFSEWLRQGYEEYSSFSEWLHRPEPDWKINIEQTHYSVFKELKMSKDEIIKLLEKLDEHGIFRSVPRD